MTMKKNVLLSLLFVLMAGALTAQRGQRIGYIDMEYILENVPEYQEANTLLDKKVGEWKAEIATMENGIKQMQQSLDNERPLLTPELIEEREEAIRNQQQILIEYQQKRFGPAGDYFLQKEQLRQPVQDQVFTTVRELAAAKNYDIVFDKSDVTMLYSVDRHDLSDQILRRIQRTSKRKQATSRAEEKQIEAQEEEAKEREENAEFDARKQALEDKKEARRKAAEERRKKREEERERKRKEYEERRAKLLEERQRKKDSITAARNKEREERQKENEEENEGGGN